MLGGSRGGNGTHSVKSLGGATTASLNLERNARLWLVSTQFSTSRMCGRFDSGVSSNATTPVWLRTVATSASRYRDQVAVRNRSDGTTASSIRQAKPRSRRPTAGAASAANAGNLCCDLDL